MASAPPCGISYLEHFQRKIEKFLLHNRHHNVIENHDNLQSIKYLQKKNISYSVFTHSTPVVTIEQAARERGQVPDQIVRNILFRVSDEVYVMVLAAGPDQVSWRKLRQYLGISRITMATSAEVLRITGALPGSVTPLGLPEPIRILADINLQQQENLSLGSGMIGTAILIQRDDLISALPSIEFGDFISSRTTSVIAYDSDC